MTQQIKATALACLALALGACLSSSPPARFFGLTPMPADSGPYDAQAVTLGLGPMDVADYLKRPQIVTRGPGNEFTVDDYARWAERLDSAIPRVLAANIDALSPGVVAVAIPYSPAVSPDYRLIGRIHRFDTDASGLAILELQWGLGRQGETISDRGRARYTAQASDPEDPAAIVAALQETLEACSRDLAAAVQAEIVKNQ